MNQSSFIVGALLAAFVLFLAARGRLPVYASVLWGPAPSTGSAGSSGPSKSPGGLELPDLSEKLGDVNFSDVLKFLPAIFGAPVPL